MKCSEFKSTWTHANIYIYIYIFFFRGGGGDNKSGLIVFLLFILSGAHDMLWHYVQKCCVWLYCHYVCVGLCAEYTAHYINLLWFYDSMQEGDILHRKWKDSGIAAWRNRLRMKWSSWKRKLRPVRRFLLLHCIFLIKCIWNLDHSL